MRGEAEGYILCFSFIIPDTTAYVLSTSKIHIDILIKSLLIGMLEEKRKKDKKGMCGKNGELICFFEDKL